MTGEPSDSVTLSIIIVNWNTRDLLAACLESVAAEIARMGEGEAETFVIDNASIDGSPEMVQERFPWVQLIRNTENVGFARANNQAIRQASGRNILLLNSDAQLRPGILASLLEHLDTYPSTGIGGVCQVFPDGRPQFCYGRFPTLWREAKGLLGLHRWDLRPLSRMDRPISVDWVSGACLIVRHDVLDQIGSLDETFFMFGEEVDLCYRTIAAGWRVCLVPSTPLVHVRAGSGGKTPERIMKLYRGKYRYFCKHLGRVNSAVFRSLIYASSIGKWVIYTVLATIDPGSVEKRCLWSEVSLRLAHDGIN